jgi:hypothetical protein
VRALADDEFPEGPEAAADRRPWLLRPRLVAVVVVAGALLALLARVDHPVFRWGALPAQAAVALLLAIYLWHVTEHSLLGRPAPPRLRWLVDAPGRHPGLSLWLVIVGGAWGAAALVAPRVETLALAGGLGLVFLLATPWLCLTLVQTGGVRRPGLGEALSVLDDLGGPGIVGSLLLVAALAGLGAGLVTGLDSVAIWWALAAGVLLAGRRAGRLFETRAVFLGVQTEEDLEQEADEAAFRARVDRLLQRFHYCRETGDVPQAVRLLEAFLAEDEFVHDQRMLHELGQWRWPRLVLEHARNVASRLLAGGKERAAWALVMEQVPLDTGFLPASLDDLAQLAETAASPGERRAVMAMVRRVDRNAGDDERLARVWLAAAEVALAEGEASPARVWLGRAETRYPRQLGSADRRARREALRRALGGPA